jgi:hypothetical protein
MGYRYQSTPLTLTDITRIIVDSMQVPEQPKIYHIVNTA